MALEQRGQITILRGSNVKQVEDERSPSASSPNDVQDKDVCARVLFEEPMFPPQSFDHIVYALGGTTPTNFLKAARIAFDGNVPVIKEGYETNVPGLYLIGDLSAGRKGGSINLAFNMAEEAMRNICKQTPDICVS
jgi:thioredoxin reductase (NADPH)